MKPVYIRAAAPPGEVGVLTNPGNFDDMSQIGEAQEYVFYILCIGLYLIIEHTRYWPNRVCFILLFFS